MAEAARYMFDRTFDAPVKGTEPDEVVAARKIQEEWERKMAEACCSAFEAGQAEGQTEALKGIEETTRAETGVLVESATRMLGNVEQECDQIRQNAIKLATMTANVLAEELISRNPSLNLEKLFTEALEHLGDAPHIALTVNDEMAEGVQKNVTEIAADRGFSGKIVVLGDPETKKGDCSLQWADGGISLDFEKTRAEVTRLVRRHLGRLNSGAGDPLPAPAPEPEPVEMTATEAAPQSNTGTEPVSETVTGPGETK